MTKFKKLRWKWLAAGAGIGAVLVLAVGTVYTAVIPAKAGRIAQGNSIRTDQYEMRVGKPRSVEFDPAFTTVPESDLVIIPVTLTNRSFKTVQFFPVLNTYLRDTTGGIYTMHPTLYMNKPLPAKDLAPGETLSGELSYEIPKTLKVFKFYIDPGWNEMAPVVFSLKR